MAAIFSHPGEVVNDISRIMEIWIAGQAVEGRFD
jgi:hypothetical protein